MLQDQNKGKRHLRASSSASGTTVTRLKRPAIDNVATVLAISRGHGVNGEELLQQGLHLILHSFGGSLAVLLIHRLKQGVEVDVGVAKMKMTEDTRQS